MNYEDKYVLSELIPTHCIPPSPLQNVHLFAILSTHRYPHGIYLSHFKFLLCCIKSTWCAKKIDSIEYVVGSWKKDKAGA